VHRIPVGLLTGFLGSGKTTLLTRLLPQPAFAAAAVIINEFGEVSIDHLVVATLSEHIVELRNGCLCCTIRGDLVMTLRDLYRLRQLGEIKAFDRVIIETSGLADPIPLLHTLMANEPLMRVFAIDTVVTVVDAAHAPATLSAHQTATDQVAMADLLVISKTDVATPAELDATSALLNTLNPHAPRILATNVDCASQQIFGRDLFNPARRRDAIAAWLGDHTAHVEAGHSVHDHTAHGQPGSATYDHGVHYQAHVIVHDGPVSLAGLTVFLNGAVNEQRERILRIKGIAGVREKGGAPAVVHAVQNKFYPVQWLSEWPDTDHRCRLVFIGRDLDTARLDERFGALCV
jgi:G3E family GTPase